MVQKMCERLEKQLPDQNSSGKILALAPNSSNEE